MTQKQIENAIKNLQLSVATLASKTYTRESNNEDNISKINNKTREVEVRIDETNSIIETNADALDYVVEEIIPEQSSKQEIMESTLEYILTEVIPSLMGDE